MDGVMEELLNNLQAIKSLSVCGRTSVEQYRGQNKPIPEIAKELGVNYIVEGSGQKSGKSLRMRVQLIMTVNKKEKHIWGNSFEQQSLDLTEYFKTQAGFAQSIANEINAALTKEEKEFIDKIPTVDITAYDAYLKGQFYEKTFNLNELDSAMYYYELAKEKDPEFAPAYLGTVYVWLARQQLGEVPPEEAGPKIMAGIDKAIELDSTLAGIHLWVGVMDFFGTWDWKKAESAFKKAIAINPNYAEAYAYFSHLLNIQGHPGEAMKYIDLALKLDPLNPMIKVMYSQDLLFVHRYDEAVSVCKELYKQYPTMFAALDPLFNALYMQGRNQEAFEIIKLYFTIFYHDFNHVFDQYTKLGFAGTLNLEGDTLVAQAKTRNIVFIDIAYLYLFAGNKERTLDCLEHAYELHDPNIPYITRPAYYSLRDEPRYQELLKKLNLTLIN
jgi:TolB-like protein